jgi:hypothetical protein
VVFIVLWLLAWDVLLHEGGLFRDWAGLTSPATPGTLFRWGSLTPILADNPDRLAATSASRVSASTLLMLRGTHLVATLVLTWLVVRKKIRSSARRRFHFVPSRKASGQR